MSGHKHSNIGNDKNDAVLTHKVKLLSSEIFKTLIIEWTANALINFIIALVTSTWQVKSIILRSCNQLNKPIFVLNIIQVHLPLFIHPTSHYNRLFIYN